MLAGTADIVIETVVRSLVEVDPRLIDETADTGLVGMLDVAVSEPFTVTTLIIRWGDEPEPIDQDEHSPRPMPITLCLCRHVFTILNVREILSPVTL